MRVSIRTNRGDLLSSRRDSRTRGTFASLREEREAIGGEKKGREKKKRLKRVEGTLRTWKARGKKRGRDEQLAYVTRTVLEEVSFDLFRETQLRYPTRNLPKHTALRAAFVILQKFIV